MSGLSQFGGKFIQALRTKTEHLADVQVTACRGAAAIFAS